MTAAILQARMGSTRLPGKMLLPIFQNKGALELMLDRVARATSLERILVATTVLSEDDVLASLCERLGVPCFRGDPSDVLDRYYRCARFFGEVGTLVRLTGDCPLHDPAIIDRVVRFFNEGEFDYAANTHPPTFPDGLDAEVFTFAALEKAWTRATLLSEREHVTYYLYTHPGEFRLGNFFSSTDLSALRWTLDEPADLEFIRRIYAELGGNKSPFHTEEIVDLLRRRPELLAINQDIERNVGLKKTLLIDRELGKLK